MKEQRLHKCTTVASVLSTLEIELDKGWFLVTLYVDPTERFSFIVVEREKVEERYDARPTKRRTG